MRKIHRSIPVLLAALVMSLAAAADLAPDHWPAGKCEQAEQREQLPFPLQDRTVRGAHVLISATGSPTAVEAGMQVLGAGGNAADAATAVALM